MRRALLLLVLFSATAVRAQQVPSIDPRGEAARLKESCFTFTFSDLGACAEELFTGVPLHIAVGSIAPQNGFGGGLAYVGHHTTDNWRDNWNADAIATGNGSWRAGFYAKFIHTPNETITVTHGPPQPGKTHPVDLKEHTIFGLYAQANSLNKLTFFGEGPNTIEARRTYFGLT